jgi:hypothetical protein
VITVGGGDEPPRSLGCRSCARISRRIFLPLTTIDDPLVAERGADATKAVGFELVADRQIARMQATISTSSAGAAGTS